MKDVTTAEETTWEVLTAGAQRMQNAWTDTKTWSAQLMIPFEPKYYLSVWEPAV